MYLYMPELVISTDKTVAFASAALFYLAALFNPPHSLIHTLAAP
jgi:hypothetical protein